MPKISLSLLLAVSFLSAPPVQAEPTMKALIIDGQNNHSVWPKTSQMMKSYLEATGMFTVDIATTAKQGTDSNFKPDFQKYNVIVSNYNGADWPAETQRAFVSYVQNGGGFVVVHAANNAFPKWSEFNEMIGLGGWGGRNEKSGPYVYVNEKGETVRDTRQGSGGRHGPQHPFSVVVRDDQHPITKGMPREWLHVQDELYDSLRGPAENMHILATAFADPSKGGTGRHEPMIFTVQYGKGRVFHTALGHGDYSQECVGFIATFQRGAEWAATGKVTQRIPADFPTAEKISQRKYPG
jgi:type 1 glutamine amidotransferase